MRVFVTGATGFIGSALIPELISAGHQVLGLTRSENGAKSLQASGAQPHHGDLNDIESLRSGAAASDAVIHTAFTHDFSRYAESCESDRRAIETLGAVLAGSDRPFVVTSGLARLASGRAATELEPAPPAGGPFPRASEQTAAALAESGVRTSIVRLPQVHNTDKQGLVSYAIAAAREKRQSAYIGEGKNRWAAVHVLDCARLYRLALEKGETGARYHAVAEEGVPLRDIAEAIGRGLHVPVVSLTQESAPAHFGWLATLAAWDLTGTSEITQQKLGWRPTGPGLIADLDAKAWS